MGTATQSLASADSHREAQQTVDSLVPILYHHYGDMDIVVAKVVGMVQKEIQAFDRTAEKLLEKYIDETMKEGQDGEQH